MSDDATQFALQHCRALSTDPLDEYIINSSQDGVVAMTSLSNFHDAIRLIPDDLSYAEEKEYRIAIGQRCAELVRLRLSRAHEFDLR